LGERSERRPKRKQQDQSETHHVEFRDRKLRYMLLATVVTAVVRRLDLRGGSMVLIGACR
jgi:hypothetical protein